MAMASTPGIAYAEPSGSPSSTSDSSSTSKSNSTTSTSSSTGTSSADSDTKTVDGPDEPTSGEVDGSAVETDIAAGDDTVEEDAEEGDGAEEPIGSGGEDETSPATGDEIVPSADGAAAQGDVLVKDSPSVDSADQGVSGGHGARAFVPDASDNVDSSVTAT